MKILAICGSYRDGGSTDQLLTAAAEGCRETGAEVELVFLRNQDIRFCSNCRACTQAAGSDPGSCAIDDAMPGLIQRIEQAEGLILASPHNFFNITALMRCFLERLICYAYWPWSMKTGPKPRRLRRTKRAALICTSAAPGPIARWFLGAVSALRLMARTVGAKPIGSMSVGMQSEQEPGVGDGSLRRAKRLGIKLARRCQAISKN
jgi:NAD(P)H-dependent FMN reductase